MAICRHSFTDEERAALQATVSTIQSRTIQCYTSEQRVRYGLAKCHTA